MVTSLSNSATAFILIPLAKIKNLERKILLMTSPYNIITLPSIVVTRIENNNDNNNRNIVVAFSGTTAVKTMKNLVVTLLCFNQT